MVKFLGGESEIIIFDFKNNEDDKFAHKDIKYNSILWIIMVHYS